MKQVFLFSLVMFIYSCNLSAEKNQTGVKAGNGQTETAAVSSDTEVPGDPAKKAANEASTGTGELPCTRLIFFQPGTVVESVSTDAKGKETSRQLTRILAITDKDGFTVANAESTVTMEGVKGKQTNVKYDYKCDGKNVYFDIASMFRTDSKNNETGFESSTIPYPINVKAGQTLPDASGVMSSTSGKRKMTMTYTFSNRKVTGMEEVTTAAGTWKCYKISMDVDMEMDIPGMDENVKKMMKQMKDSRKMSSITWFSPDFGVVKTETYLNGELQSKNEVVAVKR